MSRKIRPEKVREMQAKIRAGTWDLDFKIDVAAERLLKVILSDKNARWNIDRAYVPRRRKAA